jgi:hypothetical protein
MASSGSYDFTVTRDQIITDAHLLVGVLGEGEAPSPSQITEAARMFNMILKLRAADGMPLWSLKRGSILPVTGTSSINTNSHVVTFYDSTTLSAAAASSATTISIAAAGTIANSDNIGIELSNGDMFWTTVSSGGGTTTLVLATGLSSAASSGARVYAYTATADRIQRPIRILEANILQVVDSYSWSIEVIPAKDYYNLSNKTSEGVPVQIYYEPALGTSVASPDSSTTWYGTIFFWPRFQDGKKVIEFTYQRPFQDMDSNADTPDFPQAFYLPLTLELASMLAAKFGLPLEERGRLANEAKMYREEALSTIVPEGSLRIVPDYDRWSDG